MCLDKRAGPVACMFHDKFKMRFKLILLLGNFYLASLSSFFMATSLLSSCFHSVLCKFNKKMPVKGLCKCLKNNTRIRWYYYSRFIIVYLVKTLYTYFSTSEKVLVGHSWQKYCSALNDDNWFIQIFSWEEESQSKQSETVHLHMKHVWLSNLSKSYSLCLMEKVKLIHGSRDWIQDPMNLIPWHEIEAVRQWKFEKIIFKDKISKIWKSKRKTSLNSELLC